MWAGVLCLLRLSPAGGQGSERRGGMKEEKRKDQKEKECQDRGEHRYREWDQERAAQTQVKKSKEEFRYASPLRKEKAEGDNVMMMGRGVGSRSQTVRRGSVVVKSVTYMGWEAENGKCDVLAQQEGPHLSVCVRWVGPGNSAPGFGWAVQKGYLPDCTVYNFPDALCQIRLDQTRLQ